MKVYIVSLATDTGSKFHKIGWTQYPDERLYGMQISSPFPLAIVCQADLGHLGSKIESALHRRFQGKHVRGEWFRLSDDDILWINLLFEEATAGLVGPIEVLARVCAQCSTGNTMGA